jgi:hypothetical protein
MEKEVKGRFRFDQDSKRYHRFKMEADEGVVGVVYVPKSAESLPDVLTLRRGENPEGHE